MAEAEDPLLTPELNRYNLEYNLLPYRLNDQPFLNTEKDIRKELNYLETLAQKHGGRMAIVGILPTLRQQDFCPQSMSDRPRYHALVKELVERRGSTFKININGADPLQLDMTDITLEGANTSFQMHYRVEPEAFADTYNAFQLMTPLAVAIAANSPTLFGHSLWQETRIPLFKQSIDMRALDRYHWHAPPRVNFGNGWLHRGPYELFNEVDRYMGVIENRLETGQTGALWQQQSLARLQATQSRRQSLHLMLERLVQNGHSNQPVGDWRIDD